MSTDQPSPSQPNVPRFCDQCGKSLVPLTGWHVSRSCEQCGRTIFVAEPGEGGKGLQIRKGDKIHIPPGTIALSLDPARGRLSRAGIALLEKILVFVAQPPTPDGVDALLTYYEHRNEKLLRSSPLLEDLDSSHEGWGDLAWERVKGKDETPEFWAILQDVWREKTRDAIAAGDAREAAFAMYHAANANTMLLLREQSFEETLWRGYRANITIHDAGAAAGHIPGETEALKKLEPVFLKLDEGTIQTWVNSGLPISPRLGVSELPEETLQAYAKWQLQLRERQRVDEYRREDERRSNRDILIKGIGVGASVMFGVVTAVLAVLKALGIIGAP